MPIYAYRCSACGHQKDHLQRLADAPLTKCPACGKKKYEKQLTAAGFQLKGSGWYATDFKGARKGDGGRAGPKPKAKTEAKTETKTEAKTETKTKATTKTKADKKSPASPTN